MEAEHPDEAALAPMEISEYSCIYIKYVQIFRKLEEAYDQMCHPQKRADMKKAVESVLGRILEIKTWLVRLNKARLGLFLALSRRSETKTVPSHHFISPAAVRGRRVRRSTRR